MDVGPLRDLVTVVLGLVTGMLSGLFGVGGGVLSQPGMRLLGIAAAARDRHRPARDHPGRGERARAATHARALIRWPAVVATVPAGHRRRGGGRRRRRTTCPATATCSSWPPPGLLGAVGLPHGSRSGRRSPPDEPLAETDAPEAPDLPTLRRPVPSALHRRRLLRPLRGHRR